MNSDSRIRDRCGSGKAVLGHHARCNVHCHQLLEQQLGGVRNPDLGDASHVAAWLAAELLGAWIGDRNQTANVADVHRVRVRHIEQTFLEDVGDTVRDHAVALHFTNTQAAVTRTTLHRLTGKDLHRSARARVDLVVHHVLESLVVRGSEVNLCIELAAGEAVVEHLVSVFVVVVPLQRGCDMLHADGGEGRCIADLASLAGHLADQTLQQVPNGHATGNGVWVHDDVWIDALTSKRHVLLPVRDAAGALLSVATGELVTDLRNADRPHAHLHKPVAVVGVGDHHLVNHTGLTGAQELALAALLES
eukprot:m.916303 g.916303  ORF g.916303 m.916303 type:complete len:306 (-) comp60162_c0_seq1:2712-3629(-)